VIARAAPRVGLTIGSLFSGIGGLELGLERAGLGPVKFQVEIDPYCRAVLAKHWPDVERFDDVRTVGRGNLAPVDVICGGFPCQGISAAGKGLGLADPRSGLWTEYARIVGEIRPRYVVVENSPMLAGRGLDRVLADLADLGFDAEWFPLAACEVGAPHERERVFIVAYAEGAGSEAWARDRVGVADGSHGHAGVASRSGSASVATYAESSRLEGRHGSGNVRTSVAGPGEGRWAVEGIWESEPDVGRVAHGVPSRTHRLAALGNAVVPQVAEVVGWVVRGIHERLTR
jgi:DNA (cytosine-5)-methyltransferase 1